MDVAEDDTNLVLVDKAGDNANKNDSEGDGKGQDRKSTRLNSSHPVSSRMPSSA